MIANLDANAFNVLQAEYKANRLQPTNTPSLITRSCFSLLLLLQFFFVFHSFFSAKADVQICTRVTACKPLKNAYFQSLIHLNVLFSVCICCGFLSFIVFHIIFQIHCMHLRRILFLFYTFAGDLINCVSFNQFNFNSQ